MIKNGLIDEVISLKVILLTSLSFIILFISLSFLNSILSLILVLGIYLLRGIITPILKNEININTSSNKRATVLSIRSFIIRISFAIFAPLLGYIADSYSLSHTFLILAIAIGSFSLLSALKLYNSD